MPNPLAPIASLLEERVYAPVTKALAVGDHILRTVTVTPTRYAPFTRQASCSCGAWKADAISQSHARELHQVHFDEVTQC